MMGDPLSLQMSADILSMTRNPITFIFYAPNQVEIAPVHALSNNYVVLANVVHPDHLGTIPVGLQEPFRDLALCDVSRAILSMRKRFSNMQTSFGSMELNISDLEDNVGKREEILEKMQTDSVKYGKRKKIFIA